MAKILSLALLAMLTVVPASAQNQRDVTHPCNRACLTRVVDTYVAGLLANDLQPAALSLRPALRDTLAAGEEAGALAGIVSGSGPTCVFLCKDAHHANAVAQQLTTSGACRAARVAHGPVAGARVS